MDLSHELASNMKLSKILVTENDKLQQHVSGTTAAVEAVLRLRIPHGGHEGPKVNQNQKQG